MSKSGGVTSSSEAGDEVWVPMTHPEMLEKAKREAAKVVPLQKGQQYKEAVKEALKNIRRQEEAKLERSAAASEDGEYDDEDPDYEEDEVQEIDDDDEEDEDEDEDDDEEDDEEEEIAELEREMKTQEVVRRGSTAAAVPKVGAKPKPLVRRESAKSLPSTSGSLGKVSALPKKRPAQPRKKKYGEVDPAPQAKVKRGSVGKGKKVEKPRKVSSAAGMDDCEGAVEMDIADFCESLTMTPFLCHIGQDVFVKISKFRGKWWISIREYKEGKAQNRGINFELSMLKKLKDAIDAAATHASV